MTKMERKFVTRFSKKDIFAYLKSFYGERFIKYREDWERSSKGEVLPEFPLCLNYEIFDACNLRCIHCARLSYSNNRGRLGLRLFKKTIDEGMNFGLPSIKIGFGEPFMDNEIFEMVEYARDKKVMDVIVTTNGTLINGNMVEKILGSGITFLRISVDAATGGTYSKIRRANLYELEETIMMLLRKREEKRLEIPVIRLSFVIMEENKHEMDIFKNKWLDIVDFIDFQDYVDYSYLNLTDLEIIKSDFFCPYPWQMVPSMANGDIRACCSWYGRDLVLGNIKENSIKEAWDSPGIFKIRNQILNRTYANSCAKCIKGRGETRVVI